MTHPVPGSAVAASTSGDWASAHKRRYPRGAFRSPTEERRAAHVGSGHRRHPAYPGRGRSVSTAHTGPPAARRPPIPSPGGLPPHPPIGATTWPRAHARRDMAAGRPAPAPAGRPVYVEFTSRDRDSRTQKPPREAPPIEPESERSAERGAQHGGARGGARSTCLLLHGPPLHGRRGPAGLLRGRAGLRLRALSHPLTPGAAGLAVRLRRGTQGSASSNRQYRTRERAVHSRPRERGSHLARGQ